MTPLARLRTLRDRCNDYLQHGGFFNPELMDTRKVSELIEDCRALLTDLEAASPTEPKEKISEPKDKVSRVSPSATLPSTGSPAPSTNGSSETLFRIPLDPTVFVDGEETFNFAALLSFVLNGVRLRGQSIVSARKPVAGEAVASRPAAQESKVKLLKADDLRAWLRTSDNTIHIGEHSLDVDHARRIARDILELTTCPGNFGGPGPHSCVYCGGLLACAVAPAVEGARPPAEDLVAIRAAWQVAVDRNLAQLQQIEGLQHENARLQARLANEGNG